MNIIEKIEAVLEEKVRPSLLAHEGNVQILEFTDGILKIRLTGQCAGCPSARLTTEELIGKTVMDELPQVQDVVLVNEVFATLSSDELNFYRIILSN